MWWPAIKKKLMFSESKAAIPPDRCFISGYGPGEIFNSKVGCRWPVFFQNRCLLCQKRDVIKSNDNQTIMKFNRLMIAMIIEYYIYMIIGFVLRVQASEDFDAGPRMQHMTPSWRRWNPCWRCDSNDVMLWHDSTWKMLFLLLWCFHNSKKYRGYVQRCELKAVTVSSQETQWKHRIQPPEVLPPSFAATCRWTPRGWPVGSWEVNLPWYRWLIYRWFTY